MKINRVAIIGAGAVGAYFIWGLSEKLGENLWVVAEGKRKERLEKEGITINKKRYALNIKTPEQAKNPDLILVAVKYGALQSVIPAIKTMTGENTIIISPMNGVESEDIIAEAVGMDHLVHSIIRISSERDGNSINFNGPKTQGLYYGEAYDKARKDRTEAVAELFADTDLHYTIEDDIVKQIWFKYALNVSRNLPQAILGVPVGAYYDSEHVDFISTQMRNEVIAVAKAKGIDIGAEASDPGRQAVTLRTARFSTLQDLDAGRKTEIDMFSGAMIRMGKELGIPTPYNEFAYHAIKALEEKNDGLFNYE